MPLSSQEKTLRKLNRRKRFLFVMNVCGRFYKRGGRKSNRLFFEKHEQNPLIFQGGGLGFAEPPLNSRRPVENLGKRCRKSKKTPHPIVDNLMDNLIDNLWITCG